MDADGDGERCVHILHQQNTVDWCNWLISDSNCEAYISIQKHPQMEGDVCTLGVDLPEEDVFIQVEVSWRRANIAICD